MSGAWWARAARALRHTGTMRTRDRRGWFAIANAVIFGLGAVGLLVHIVTRRHFGELPSSWSIGIASVGIVLFLGAAVTLLFGSRSPRVAGWSFDLTWLGALWMLSHGLIARLAGDMTGIAYILASFVVAVLAKRSFEPLVGTPGELPAQPASHRIDDRRGVAQPVI